MKPNKKRIEQMKKNAKDKNLGPSIREWYIKELEKIGVKV